jgi:hypothetical protein
VDGRTLTRRIPMKKTDKKPLKLAIETVRTLVPLDLTAIRGGNGTYGLCPLTYQAPCLNN